MIASTDTPPKDAGIAPDTVVGNAEGAVAVVEVDVVGTYDEPSTAVGGGAVVTGGRISGVELQVLHLSMFYPIAIVFGEKAAACLAPVFSAAIAVRSAFFRLVLNNSISMPPSVTRQPRKPRRIPLALRTPRDERSRGRVLAAPPKRQRGSPASW